MDNLQERVRLYLVDKPDDSEAVREKLRLYLWAYGLGEREVDGKVMYSAAWIDDKGNRREFQA